MKPVRIAPIPVALVVLLAGFQGALVAQVRCAERISRPPLVAGATPASALEEDIFARLDRGTWELSTKHNSESLPGGPEAYTSPESLAWQDVEYFAGLMGTTETAPIVAKALAAIVRGEDAGYTADQGWVAAGLYYLWKMPAAPATEVLSDRGASVRAHGRAILALRNRWVLPEVRSAILDVLCGLALRSQGLTDAAAANGGHGPTLLSTEEEWLLGLVQRALLEGEAIGELRPISLDALFTSSNPVIRQVEQYLAAGRKTR